MCSPFGLSQNTCCCILNYLQPVKIMKPASNKSMYQLFCVYLGEQRLHFGYISEMVEGTTGDIVNM